MQPIYITYQFIFSYATVAEKVVTIFLLASDEIVYTFCLFTLVTLIKAEVTWLLPVFSLRSIPHLSNNDDNSKSYLVWISRESPRGGWLLYFTLVITVKLVWLNGGWWILMFEFFVRRCFGYIIKADWNVYSRFRIAIQNLVLSLASLRQYLAPGQLVFLGILFWGDVVLIIMTTTKQVSITSSSIHFAI